MSAAPAAKQKLFVLRIFTSVAARTISDNSAELWADLDRGWQISCYETILADTTRGTCHILVRLTTTLNISATPTHPPATPVPPPTKLLVLSTDSGDENARYNDQTLLAGELDRGWLLDGYEVVLSSPEDFSCFVLVKLANPGTLTARIPGS